VELSEQWNTSFLNPVTAGVGAEAILTQVTDFSCPMCSLLNPTLGHRLLSIRMGE
jgi:hypothetical protein